MHARFGSRAIAQVFKLPSADHVWVGSRKLLDVPSLSCRYFQLQIPESSAEIREAEVRVTTRSAGRLKLEAVAVRPDENAPVTESRVLAHRETTVGGETLLAKVPVPAGVRALFAVVTNCDWSGDERSAPFQSASRSKVEFQIGFRRCAD